MQTFTQNLTNDNWTEVLTDFGYLAFDCTHSAPVHVYLTQSFSLPATDEPGNLVRTWPEGWDFSASDMVAGVQKIYVRGDNIITGVRG